MRRCLEQTRSDRYPLRGRAWCRTFGRRIPVRPRSEWVRTAMPRRCVRLCLPSRAVPLSPEMSSRPIHLTDVMLLPLPALSASGADSETPASGRREGSSAQIDECCQVHKLSFFKFSLLEPQIRRECHVNLARAALQFDEALNQQRSADRTSRHGELRDAHLVHEGVVLQRVSD